MNGRIVGPSYHSAGEPAGSEPADGTGY